MTETICIQIYSREETMENKILRLERVEMKDRFWYERHEVILLEGRVVLDVV